MKHRGSHKSADYILELVTYCYELRELYKHALSFGWGPQREKHIAFHQLVKLVDK